MKAVTGCAMRPPRVEVVRVERVDGPLLTVVVRCRRRGTPLPVPLLYRLRLARPSGAILEACVNGVVASPAILPGVVIDLAQTAALDALGALQPGWLSS